MKKHLIYIFFLFLMISFQTRKEKKILDYFPKRDTIIVKSSKIIQPPELPKSVVLEYLCDVKNECELNTYNEREYHYYPLSKKELNGFFILSYIRTDTYKHDIYLRIFDKDMKRGLKLHVYSDMYPEINSVIKDDKIEIFRKLNIECPNEKLNCIKTIKNKYKLDKKFTSLTIKKKKFILPSVRSRNDTN